MTTENASLPQGEATAEELAAKAAAEAAAKPAEGLEVGVEPTPPEPTGDPALDVALGFFSKNGIPPTSAAMVLAGKGDFSVLKAELASKGSKGWEQYVAIAEQSFARTTADAASAKAKALATVVEVCGSQEKWAEVKTFVAEKADESELAQINEGLRAGGVVAKAVAKYMLAAFEAGNGTAPAQTTQVGNGRGGNAAVSGPLSPREYTDAVSALAQKIGANALDGSKEYKALQGRRRAYRG